MTETTRTVIAYSITVIGFAVGVTIKYYDGSDGWWIAALFLALIAPVASLQLSLQPRIKSTEDRVSNEVLPVLRTVSTKLANMSSRGYVNNVGKVSEAAKIVSDRLTIARRARNTFVGSADRLYSIQESLMIDHSIVSLLRNPDSFYEEVCSLQGAERSDRIASENPVGKYRFHQTKPDNGFPTCNFIILDYPSGPSEVFFGWGFFTNKPDTHVFATTDQDLVSYFESYFEALQAASRKLRCGP